MSEPCNHVKVYASCVTMAVLVIKGKSIFCKTCLKFCTNTCGIAIQGVGGTEQESNTSKMHRCPCLLAINRYKLISVLASSSSVKIFNATIRSVVFSFAEITRPYVPWPTSRSAMTLNEPNCTPDGVTPPLACTAACLVTPMPKAANAFC